MNARLLGRSALDAGRSSATLEWRTRGGSAPAQHQSQREADLSWAGQMALPLDETSWREVCGLWLADRSRSCATRTLIAYEKSARLTLVPALGHLPAGAVTRQLVHAMHAEAVQLRGPAAANQAIAHGRMAWRFSRGAL